MKGRGMITPGRFAALFPVLALLLVLAACESAEPPATCGPLAGQTLTVGQTATVTACFEDPNGDLLTCTAASADPSVATPPRWTTPPLPPKFPSSRRLRGFSPAPS